jgi:hypothetical protein
VSLSVNAVKRAHSTQPHNLNSASPDRSTDAKNDGPPTNTDGQVPNPE